MKENIKIETLAVRFIVCTVCCIFLLFPNLCNAEELIFWNFWDQKFILPVIAQFEKENPGIKIKSEQVNWGNGLDKIVIAMANGRAPDICELGSTWMGKFMAEGALLDVTDKFSDLKSDYLMWEPVTFKGRLYGMPWLVGTRVLFYNRALFKKAGMNPEKPPVTWQQLLDTAKTIHNPSEGIYGFGMNAGEGHILYKKFMPFVWGNHGQIIDEKGNFIFDSVQTREALDYYLKLKEYSYCEKQDLLDEGFRKGQIGLTISGSWNFARYPIDAPNLDFGVALLPRPSKNSGFSTSFLGGEILVLFKSCKNPEMAAKFVRYLTRIENTLPITKEAMVSFPAHKAAYSDPFFTSDKRLSVFVEQMETAIHPPIHRLWIELERIINNLVEKAMYGEKIDQLFAEAKIEYERILQRKNNTANADIANTHASQQLADSTQEKSTDISIQIKETGDGSTQILLLMFIGVGTLLNALLLTFLLYEVKKNAA